MRTSLSQSWLREWKSQVANSLAATKKLFYYQSSADGDIKQIRESIEQLDSNIKHLHPLLDYKLAHFLMHHI
jgi:hypothetical protein